MLCNLDVAVMNKVNDLATRHGLEPYDFVAVFKFEETPGGKSNFALDFEVPAGGNRLREERFDTMLHDLGIVVEDRAVLVGSCEKIVHALDAALARAPRPKGRF